jgi:hypothetical protein
VILSKYESLLHIVRTSPSKLYIPRPMEDTRPYHLGEAELQQILQERDTLSTQPVRPIRLAEINTPLKAISSLAPGKHRQKIHFISCVFHEPVELHDLIRSGVFCFEDCIFNNDVSFQSSSNVFLFSPCYFKANLDIRVDTPEEPIGNIVFYSNLRVVAGCDKVSVNDIKTEDTGNSPKLTITGRCQRFEITNSHLQGVANNSHDRISDVKVKNCEISQLRIGNVSADIAIIKSRISSFDLSDSGAMSARLWFREVHLKHIYIPLYKVTRLNLFDCKVTFFELIGNSLKETRIVVEKGS